jgi:hypothetical protein
MHDRVGRVAGDEVAQVAVLGGDVEAVEADLAARELAPGGQPRPQRLDRRQRRGLELDVGVAPREVVDDRDVVAAGGQVQRRGPPAEPVASQDQDPQKITPRCRWDR